MYKKQFATLFDIPPSCVQQAVKSFVVDPRLVQSFLRSEAVLPVPSFTTRHSFDLRPALTSKYRLTVSKSHLSTMASKIASSIIALALAATSVDAHAFFHTGFVNGQSQGHLFGVRAPNSNSPIQDVTSSAITCNADLHSPVSTDVIEVAPGDEFGMQWNHNLDGLHQAGDADDPIASSHKGPVMVYMAKVADGAAGTNDGSGLEWFKVAEEGLNPTTGVWGVDSEFNFPAQPLIVLTNHSSDRQRWFMVVHNAFSSIR